MLVLVPLKPRHQCETTFKPTMEIISVLIKNIRQKSAGTLKKKMPINTVPTAPIPVHTAYAVPMGKVCAALYSNTILRVRQTKNPPIQYHEVTPVVSFALPRQDAKPTSNKPAIMRMNQFILKQQSPLSFYTNLSRTGQLIRKQNLPRSGPSHNDQ